MQRFGRLGRHSTGQAFLLATPRECEAVKSLGDDITRDALEEGVKTIYPGQDAKGWFVDTQGGAFTVLAQAENFRSQILNDWSADESMQTEIETWLDDALKEYAAQMCLTQMKRARLKLRRRPTWFEHYKERNSFRTSLPSQEVWDVREKENERDWSYDAMSRCCSLVPSGYGITKNMTGSTSKATEGIVKFGLPKPSTMNVKMTVVAYFAQLPIIQEKICSLCRKAI